MQSEFENATWGWAVLALILYPLVPISWATALLGCVNVDLPFVPTVLTQLACSFLNLITPNGIGGTGLQLDYLHKEGVPVASGASAMVLSTGVGGAIQMVLFLFAAAITSTPSRQRATRRAAEPRCDRRRAALIGIVLAIPKVRGKVVPAVKRAANDIWAVLRNPKKAMQLFGGDTGRQPRVPVPARPVPPRVRSAPRASPSSSSCRSARACSATSRRCRAASGCRKPRSPPVSPAFGIDSTRARHGARLPGHHVRAATGLRVLHAAVAAGQGLHVTHGEPYSPRS